MLALILSLAISMIPVPTPNGNTGTDPRPPVKCSDGSYPKCGIILCWCPDGS